MKIAIFGKLRNLGWGLEHLICHAQDRVSVPMALYNYEEMLLRLFWDSSITHAVILQGRQHDREGLRKWRGKKILWNAEFLPYPGFEEDPKALARLQAIEPLEDYDLILNGCPMSTDWLRAVRGINARWFPMMGVDPLVHRRIPEIVRDIDVGFYGVSSERRTRLFRGIVDILFPHGITCYWVEAWGEDLIQFINRCKIMLNLHYTEQLNTESRVYEVLGCKTALLSEPLSHVGVFNPGIHFEVAQGAEAIAKKAIALLDDAERREQVAAAGYEYVHTRFPLLGVLEQLAKICEAQA